MRRTVKLSLFLFFALLLPVVSGCGRDDFFPSADLAIKFEESNITPTGVNDLPISTLEVIPLNGVTSTLTSYSIEYSTYLGEAIPSLAMQDIPLNIRVLGAEDAGDEGEEVSFELRIYIDRVRDLYLTTHSQISPILAKITFTFKDIHSNTGVVTTYARLFKPDDETEGTDDDP
jgi:hypothetical protein